ncbi:MAG TPA: hypothetical protein VMV60_01455 [Thermoanaerobaculia bacterium]|nr:hypothetical protein [Thermoanaerobaculia bacterium]
MVQVETYTARNFDDPADRFGVCPRCGRTGVERETAEGRVCVHAESLEMMSDGILVAPVDFCPVVLLLPFFPSHPAYI